MLTFFISEVGLETRGLMTYEYSIEDCDVSDRAQLDVYRQKRSEWLYLLSGDPDHAVWTQITAMLWNDALFRMVNETRRITSQAGYQSSARNRPLAKFIDQGFVATQTLSIRKLMERASKKAATQVVSLRRVLDDILEHRNLITREHYVAYDALPYDREIGEQAHVERALEQGDSGVHFEFSDTTGPQAWSVAESAHESFDRLSGVASHQRSRDDLIREEVFAKIDAMLTNSGYSDIVAFGNKFIAHAAMNIRAVCLSDGQGGFSLDKLTQCHKGICRAASAIYGRILWQGSHRFFATPQFDIWENLEAPWLSSEDLGTLSEKWHAHVANIEGWAEGDFLQ